MGMVDSLAQVQQIERGTAKALQELAVVLVGADHERRLGDHDPARHHEHQPQDDDDDPRVGGQVLQQDAQVTGALTFGGGAGFLERRDQLAFSALRASRHMQPFGGANRRGNLQFIGQTLDARAHLQRARQRRQLRIAAGNFNTVQVKHRLAGAHRQRGLRPDGWLDLAAR